MRRSVTARMQIRAAVKPPTDPEHLDVNARLAEMTLRWVNGERVIVLNWLRALGCAIIDAPEIGVEHSRGGALVEGLVNHLWVALPYELDPVTTCVQLGFALAGPYWPQAYPKALALVNKEWTKRVKREASSEILF